MKSGVGRATALVAGVLMALELAVPSAAQASGATITIHTGFAYVPSYVTIYVGQTVTWVNRDDTTHWVSPVKGGFIASGTIPPGDSYTATFNQAGTFEFHDSYFTFMTGAVIVRSVPPPTKKPAPKATPRPTARPAVNVATTPKPTPTPSPSPTPSPVTAAAGASGSPGASVGSSPGASGGLGVAGPTSGTSGTGSPLGMLLPILGILVVAALAFVGGSMFQARRRLASEPAFEGLAPEPVVEVAPPPTPAPPVVPEETVVTPTPRVRPSSEVRHAAWLDRAAGRRGARDGAPIRGTPPAEDDFDEDAPRY